MKLLFAVAVIVAAPTGFVSNASARENFNSSQGRVCTAISVRAGSRLSGRRICRSAREWREALGPDWRIILTGSTLQDDHDALMARTTPDDARHNPLAECGTGRACPSTTGPR